MTADETLKKREHILKSKDFRAVYNKGKSVKKNGIVLSVMRNGLGYNRLGFSISSTIVKLACTRNRARRLFREFYRKNKKLFKGDFDMVLIIRKNPGKKLLYEEVAPLFLSMARDAGIIA